MFGKTALAPWRGRFGLRQGEREAAHPLDAFRRDFDQLFQNLWRDFDMPVFGPVFGPVFRPEFRPEFGRPEAPFGAVLPTMDVTEDEDRYHIAVELPGMDEKDVEVALSDNVLTITGEKKVEFEKSEKPYTYQERSFGSFRRSIPLDADVQMDKIEATFDKGVLTILLPKTAEAKKTYRKIPVRTAGTVEKLEKAA